MGDSPQLNIGGTVHRTPEERRAEGKAARRATPRTSHAGFTPAADRPDPISLLEEQARTRVPELVPIRHGRMASSAFAFYRGAALVMAADLVKTPVSGLETQLCGDAHLANFGLFASPERNLVFDINDFDETHPGPWEWDVKRLAASLAIAGRERNFTDRQRRKIVLSMAANYRQQMAAASTMPTMSIWYQHLNMAEAMAELGPAMDDRMRRRTEKQLAKARLQDSALALTKLTTEVDGKLVFRSDPPLLVPAGELFAEDEAQTLHERMHVILRSYRKTLQSDRRALLEKFRFEALARKVVGVGSVGTRAWVLLLMGRDSGDPLLLQAKEAEASVLERFTKKSNLANHGQRVVAGQHLMQAVSDIFLGWDQIEGVDGVPRDYYVRQLRDWKGSFDVEGSIPQGMAIYGSVCGWTLARAHARAGDPIAISAYLGNSTTFDQAIADFAEAYADQNERDYDAMLAAIRTGRIAAQEGV